MPVGQKQLLLYRFYSVKNLASVKIKLPLWPPCFTVQLGASTTAVSAALLLSTRSHMAVSEGPVSGEEQKTGLLEAEFS